MTPSYKNSFSGKGVFPPRYAFTLLVPLRNMFLSPKQLLKRLDLREDHVVLEIGPGPGYFSTHVAKRLTNGRLVLLDIQQEMLDYAKKRLDKKEVTNVDYRLTDGRCLDHEDSVFDRIFMVTVLGEVDNKDGYLEDIHRILKEDGILSISELAGDPDKLSIDEVQSLVSAHGFALRDVFGGRFNLYGQFHEENDSAVSNWVFPRKTFLRRKAAGETYRSSHLRPDRLRRHQFLSGTP